MATIVTRTLPTVTLYAHCLPCHVTWVALLTERPPYLPFRNVTLCRLLSFGMWRRLSWQIKKSKEIFHNVKLGICERKRCFFFSLSFSTSFLLFAFYIVLSFLFLSSSRFLFISFLSFVSLILSTISLIPFSYVTSLLLVTSLLQCTTSCITQKASQSAPFPRPICGAVLKSQYHYGSFLVP